MKAKTPVSTKKQPVTVKDLKSKKNPKGGAAIGTVTITVNKSAIFDRWG